MSRFNVSIVVFERVFVERAFFSHCIVVIKMCRGQLRFELLTNSFLYLIEIILHFKFQPIYELREFHNIFIYLFVI